MRIFDGWEKWKKRSIVFAVDLSMTMLAWLCALWTSTDFSDLSKIQLSCTLIAGIQCIVCLFCGLYRGIWRFASIPDLMRIARAVILGVAVTVSVFFLAGLAFPLKTMIVYAIFLLVMLSGPRILFRWLHESGHFFLRGKKVLIVGAGSAGEGLVRDLRRLPLPDRMQPLGMVDDDPARFGCEVHGVRVLGSCKDIPDIVKRHRIKLILIAIPSADSHRMREIVALCEASGAPFRTLPNIRDIADGKVSINALREVLLEDLLGREQVQLDWDRIECAVSGRTILVTGGGGSIGSELCRQICRLKPQNLIIVDNNEFNLYSIDMELKTSFKDPALSVHLCSVADRAEMQKIFVEHRPQMVFHVAAYKHVPLLEKHLRVSMFNNVIGTHTVAELAGQSGVETFVLISTDKAVNPTNIMGATKRAAEVICQSYHFISPTRFITVRFGNVLNSAGSVIPLFRKQLQEGGPLTVTHRDISRFFMTITEASQLILQAATMTDDGGIFVLDMGNPIKIKYLAEQMIKLSGRAVDRDIAIEYIGLRPGEKLHEELFHDSEDVTDTAHVKIKRARVRKFDWNRLVSILSDIERACEINDETKLFGLLRALVPEYLNSREYLHEEVVGHVE